MESSSIQVGYRANYRLADHPGVIEWELEFEDAGRGQFPGYASRL